MPKLEQLKSNINIIVTMFLVVVVKIIITLMMNGPYIYADEAVYFNAANAISSGHVPEISHCQTYPWGYSLVLVPLFWLFDSPLWIYHGVLFVNVLLYLLGIYFVYLLLRDFIKNNKSLCAVLFFVSVLPAFFSHNFAVMSENLFFVCFFAQTYFFCRLLTRSLLVDWLLFGFISSVSFWVRTQGLVFIIAAFFVIFIYAFFYRNNISYQVKKYGFALGGIFLGLIPVFLEKFFLATNSSVTGYDNSYYINNFSQWFDLNGFVLNATLTAGEISYVFLATFGFGVVGYVLFLINCKENYKSMWLTALFVLMHLTLTVPVVVAHMYGIASNPQHPENSMYFMFGRYIEHIVVMIFVFGLSYFISIREIKKEKPLIVFVLLFFVCLYFAPVSNYKFPNMYGAWYLYVGDKHISAFVVYLTILCLSILAFYIGKRHFKAVFIAGLVVTILFGTYSVIKTQLQASENVFQNNRIPVFVAKNIKNKKILYHSRDFDVHQYFGLKFWGINNKIEEVSENLKSLHVNNKVVKGDYLVSSLYFSYDTKYKDDEYKLYDLSHKQEIKTFPLKYKKIGISHTEILTYDVYGDKWTKNKSEIIIPYRGEQQVKMLIKLNGHRPQENAAKIKFYINNNFIKSVEKGAGAKIYTLEIDNKYLRKEQHQVFKIETNTWQPSKYGSPDKRKLGVQIDWLKVKGW